MILEKESAYFSIEEEESIMSKKEKNSFVDKIMGPMDKISSPLIKFGQIPFIQGLQEEWFRQLVLQWLDQSFWLFVYLELMEILQKKHYYRF